MIAESFAEVKQHTEPTITAEVQLAKQQIDAAATEDDEKTFEFNKENIAGRVATNLDAISNSDAVTNVKVPFSEIDLANLPEYDNMLQSHFTVACSPLVPPFIKVSSRCLFGKTHPKMGLAASPSTPRNIPTTIHPSRSRFVNFSHYFQKHTPIKGTEKTPPLGIGKSELPAAEFIERENSETSCPSSSYATPKTPSAAIILVEVPNTMNLRPRPTRAPRPY